LQPADEERYGIDEGTRGSADELRLKTTETKAFARKNGCLTMICGFLTKGKMAPTTKSIFPLWTGWISAMRKMPAPGLFPSEIKNHHSKIINLIRSLWIDEEDF